MSLADWLPRRRRLTLRNADDEVYLDRWGIEVPALGGVLVHRIAGPDPGQDLHDHPWTFRVLVLAGAYVEEYVECERLTAGNPPATVVERRAGSFRRVGLDVAHRIVSARPGTWTLVLRSPTRRPWGFYVPHRLGGHEWVVWSDYDYEARRPGSATSSKAEEEHAYPLVVEVPVLGRTLDDDLNESWAEVGRLVENDGVEIPRDAAGNPVAIEAHQSGAEPVPAWCPRCNLSSAFTVEQILTRSDTLAEIGRFRVTFCLECSWSDPPDDGFAEVTTS